uniref:Uncharacterized protein n=1 Tax=Falco tinnunculus TaxID=100819 RepID=A0A8C4UNP0_FALTI
ITMDASFRALEAFISPSAAITWGRNMDKTDISSLGTDFCTGKALLHGDNRKVFQIFVKDGWTGGWHCYNR